MHGDEKGGESTKTVANEPALRQGCMAYEKGDESTNRCQRASLQSADLQAEEEEAHTVAGHTHAQSVSETGSPPSWSWTHLARRWRLHGCSGGGGVTASRQSWAHLARRWLTSSASCSP